LKSRPHVVDSDELELRLQLFLTISDAVHYAHQRGVIHRDLKPSNIIVSDRLTSANHKTASLGPPAVKILDFGLARLYRDSGRLDEARTTYRQALELMRREWGDDDPDVRRAERELAELDGAPTAD
jgi:serine/threonine protein kinase